MIQPKETKECSVCGSDFKPFRSTDKFCSWVCAKKGQKAGKSKETNKKHYIRPRSKKRSIQEKEYQKKRLEFLSRPENHRCRVFPKLRATQVHHMKGRIGDLLTDEHWFLPVSDPAHKKIELNPDWAKENGFSLNRLTNEQK